MQKEGPPTVQSFLMTIGAMRYSQFNKLLLYFSKDSLILVFYTKKCYIIYNISLFLTKIILISVA